MATTVTKGYELQTTGSNAGTWGATLNTDVFGIIDNNMGGITSKSLTNNNVTLSATESQNAILRLTGTLTGNVQITTACYGFFFVENLTTGSFSVTITNGAGSSFVAPQSARSTVISDSTNGVRAADTSLVPAGTVMLFIQTNAPTGWTKSTAHNNKALRVVSGTASSGGTTAFTSVFTSRPISQANLPVVSFTGTTTGNPTWSSIRYVMQGLATYASLGGSAPNVAAAGADGLTDSMQHSHSVTVSSGGSGTGMDFAVQYVDTIIATKD